MWTPNAEATSEKRTSMVLKSSSRMIEELKGTDRTNKLHDNLEKTLPTSNPLRPAQTSAITTGLFYFEIELVSTSVSRAKICVQHQTNIQAPKKETQLRCFTFFTCVHIFSHFSPYCQIAAILVAPYTTPQGSQISQSLPRLRGTGRSVFCIFEKSSGARDSKIRQSEPNPFSVPSGNLTVCKLENHHHFQWVNPLFRLGHVQ